MPIASGDMTRSQDERLPPEAADLLELALRAIRQTLQTGQPPADLAPALADYPGLDQLVSDLTALQQFALSIARGDLDQPLRLKGVMAGGLKSLQASLRHLTWQAQQIAGGDFTQRVDFMGDFAAAFNQMATHLDYARRQLEEQRAELAQRNAELQTRNAELQEALEAIKTLSGVIPICAWCGRKIRDEAGEWQSVEAYIQAHSEATFTHGICPTCKGRWDEERRGMSQAR
jgi:DNA repair exonuclease SbcCD ATPase subunit